MHPERLTIKAREALQSAHSLATRLGHPEVRALHLLLALCEQPEGIVAPVLQRLGADPRAVAARADEQLSAGPRVTGTQEVRVSRSLTEILEAADKITREFQDEYLSTEHLLLAISRSEDAAGQLLRALGATDQGVLTALREVRGSSRVTDPHPEDKFRALERYAILQKDG